MSSHNDGIAAPYMAVYLIFRKNNKIAFLLRSNTGWMNGHYGLPAGRVERGEAWKNAAMREAKEEVGITILPQNLQLVLTGHRTHPDSDWVDTVFEVTEWSGELYNAEPGVHGELAWFESHNLPENMVPYVRTYVHALEAGENYTEWGWA
jgi:ADP-ribose pyrophosphatase YjhB (NUDIX family)